MQPLLWLEGKKWIQRVSRGEMLASHKCGNKDREKLMEFCIIFGTLEFWAGKCTGMATTLIIPAAFHSFWGYHCPKPQCHESSAAEAAVLVLGRAQTCSPQFLPSSIPVLLNSCSPPFLLSSVPCPDFDTDPSQCLLLLLVLSPCKVAVKSVRKKAENIIPKSNFIHPHSFTNPSSSSCFLVVRNKIIPVVLAWPCKRGGATRIKF